MSAVLHDDSSTVSSLRAHIQANLDNVVNRLFKRFGELPDSGWLAGQSLASAIYPLAGLPEGPMNDADVFRQSVNEEPRGLKKYATIAKDTPVAGQYSLWKTSEGGGYVINNVEYEGDINTIYIDVLTIFSDIRDGERIISVFDINCCQVALCLESKSLVMTDAFIEFLVSQELKVMYLGTPMHTVSRLVKKSVDLPFTKVNWDEQLMSMATVTEIVNRIGEDRRAFIPGNLLAEINVNRFKDACQRQPLVEKYFRLCPRRIVRIDPEKNESLFHDFHILKTKQYHHLILEWYSSKVWPYTSSFENVLIDITQYLPTFISEERFVLLQTFQQHMRDVVMNPLLTRVAGQLSNEMLIYLNSHPEIIHLWAELPTVDSLFGAYNIKDYNTITMNIIHAYKEQLDWYMLTDGAKQMNCSNEMFKDICQREKAKLLEQSNTPYETVQNLFDYVLLTGKVSLLEMYKPMLEKGQRVKKIYRYAKRLWSIDNIDETIKAMHASGASAQLLLNLSCRSDYYDKSLNQFLVRRVEELDSYLIADMVHEEVQAMGFDIEKLDETMSDAFKLAFIQILMVKKEFNAFDKISSAEDHLKPVLLEAAFGESGLSEYMKSVLSDEIPF